MRGLASLWLAGLAFGGSCGGRQTNCEGVGLAGRMMADVTSGGRQTRQTQARLLPPSEDLEDLERNRRNDSDVGAAERLSSLERRKRAIIKDIGFSRYLAYGGLS